MGGVERIAAERQRQIEKEGWTPLHDDGHKKSQLAQAASSYARIAVAQVKTHTIGTPPRSDCKVWDWPWNAWFKPSADPIRNLEKAGALIAAEIDRLERAVAPAQPELLCPTCYHPAKIVRVSIGGGQKADWALCKRCPRQWRVKA